MGLAPCCLALCRSLPHAGVACRNYAVYHSTQRPELYLYSRNDPLCDIHELEPLLAIRESRRASVCVHWCRPRARSHEMLISTPGTILLGPHAPLRPSQPVPCQQSTPPLWLPDVFVWAPVSHAAAPCRRLWCLPPDSFLRNRSLLAVARKAAFAAVWQRVMHLRCCCFGSTCQSRLRLHLPSKVCLCRLGGADATWKLLHCHHP